MRTGRCLIADLQLAFRTFDKHRHSPFAGLTSPVMEVIEMTERIIELIKTKIDKYEVILQHDWLSHDEEVAMNTRFNELTKLLEEIKDLVKES